APALPPLDPPVEGVPPCAAMPPLPGERPPEPALVPAPPRAGAVPPVVAAPPPPEASGLLPCVEGGSEGGLSPHAAASTRAKRERRFTRCGPRVLMCTEPPNPGGPFRRDHLCTTTSALSRWVEGAQRTRLGVNEHTPVAQSHERRRHSDNEPRCSPRLRVRSSECWRDRGPAEVC